MEHKDYEMKWITRNERNIEQIMQQRDGEIKFDITKSDCDSQDTICLKDSVDSSSWLEDCYCSCFPVS